jgi:hypothetical protein
MNINLKNLKLNVNVKANQFILFYIQLIIEISKPDIFCLPLNKTFNHTFYHR